MAFEIITLVVLIPFLCYFLKAVFRRPFTTLYAGLQKMPGPPNCSFLVGNMRALQDTPVKIFQLLRQWGREYYPIYFLRIGPFSAVNIMNPEDLALILSDIKHIKKSKVYCSLHNWLKTGLLTSTGEKWQLRRKILTPTFHFSILQDYITIFNERTNELVGELENKCEEPHIKINEFIIHSSLKIITEAMMGTKIEFNTEKERAYEKSLREMGLVLIHRTFRSYLLFEWFYRFFPTYFKERKLLKILHNFTKDVIDSRIENSAPKSVKRRQAMVDLLLSVKNVEGLIDDGGIREEIDTFTFEGHDTVSTAIIFALMLIACYPKTQEELVQEMQDVLGDIKKQPNYKELQELKYMERCIKEVLRLYPSVHYISRELGEDLVTHTGYKLKKDTIVQLHIYDTHHNPTLYPDPEKFDPDRFLPENCDKRHPFAYIPFSAGPRNCIGQKFAMLEVKVVLCGILGNFILKPVDTPDTIVLVADIVLRTKEDIKVKFVRRN